MNKNSYFPEKRDLPDNYKTRLEEMKSIDTTWHYDPQADDKESLIRREPIKLSREEQKEIASYTEFLPEEIGASIYRGELDIYKENDLVWRKLDHIHHGYRKENTKMRYKRTSYEESPNFLRKVIDRTGLQKASAGVIRLEPGNTIPWHYDSHIFYSQSNNQEASKAERHIIFPFDWDWGHIYQIGNNVLANWKGGIRYTWPHLRYHLAGNIGISDFIMIAVTGEAG